MRLNVLMHTRHAEQFNRILSRLNPHNNVRFIEVTDFGPGLAMRLADLVAAVNAWRWRRTACLCRAAP